MTWWHPKPATPEQREESGRPFAYTHDNLKDALDQLDALSADWLRLQSAIEACRHLADTAGEAGAMEFKRGVQACIEALESEKP